jgi:hypothetical protein
VHILRHRFSLNAKALVEQSNMATKQNEVVAELNRERDEMLAKAEAIFAKVDAGTATDYDQLELERIVLGLELLSSKQQGMIRRLARFLGR